VNFKAEFRTSNAECRSESRKNGVADEMKKVEGWIEGLEKK